MRRIHVSLGGVDPVDTSGTGAIIKPLGLFFPLALLAVCAVGWPVAHIGNLAWLAIVVNVLLVAALVPLARVGPSTPTTRHGGPLLSDGP